MHFLRPNRHLPNRLSRRLPLRGSAVAALTAAIALVPILSPLPAAAQDDALHHLLNRLHAAASRPSSQGYLGVLVEDVSNESFSRLRLTDKRGAVIRLIDHDAPAGQIGLKVDDVVLAINGQNVENAAQFNSLLHELQPGRKISLLIVRDGDRQTVAVQLVDHKTMDRDVWNKLNSPDGFSPSTPGGMNMLPDGSGDAPSSGFHLPFFGSELKAGAIVEPLTAQMSGYFGIPGGVLVKQVARRSEAEAAGLRIYDIILRVGSDPIKTTSDWDRALRANQGKEVQLAILRDRHQQTLTLQVDNKHRK
jgi:serine protease Do